MDTLPFNPKTAVSSPSSSPGLFSPSQQGPWNPPSMEAAGSPYLHPLQMHKVKETHKAQVEQDFITGRKLINQYEIIDEIGRGVHGKVKLARSLETNEYVAIKIIQRFSKKRRLGRVTVSPEDKTKREIAILKKIRHPNVVGLLEVIDDPELKKIYMVLEHVELGEIVWRKKGTPQICLYERRRIERELRGESDTGDDERYFHMMERRRRQKDAKREKASASQHQSAEYWSLEHGNDEEDASEKSSSLTRQSTHESLGQFLSRSHHSNHTSLVRSENGSNHASRTTSRGVSRATSRAPSRTSSQGHTPLPVEWDHDPLAFDDEAETPGAMTRCFSGQPLSYSNSSSAAALDAQQQAFHVAEDAPYRGRSPSMADSIISHMSSIDDVVPHDAFEEDFSFVPCFTMDQARSTFRDTVLGLEYLHYEGIVHRDIKPANLLWTKDHRVKISDFGVSYFGRPIRDGETEENVSESDARDFDDDLELAKTVGTPAFFAPELCYTDLDAEQPKVSEQIDVWSLGVTLYCLIFARIPFLAEDEYQLFKAIAQQDVYIPRRRLKAVNPASRPSRADLYAATIAGEYRDETELEMEDIDDELYDLLHRMLIKDPVERIKLREVKRHPWVLRDIENVIGWLDDTDPSRKTAGRRIQVDDRELERAVVPITFLERARTAVKKAVGKVIGRSESSRKRAVSNATSSGGEFSYHSPSNPNGLGRRASLRGDEAYFAAVKESSEHPLAYSVTASPDQSPGHDDPFSQSFYTTATIDHPMLELAGKEYDNRPNADRMHSMATSIRTIIERDPNAPDVSRKSGALEQGSQSKSTPNVYATFTDHMGNAIKDPSRSMEDFGTRDPPVDLSDANVRSPSTDKFLFNSADKHAEASVAVSRAIAPGSLQQPMSLQRKPYPGSKECSPTSTEFPPLMASVHLRRPSLVAGQQVHSSPSVLERIYAASVLEDRPATATRLPESRTPTSRLGPSSTPESFSTAQEQIARRRRLEAEVGTGKQDVLEKSQPPLTQQGSRSCPLSTDDELLLQREKEQQRAQSSSSVNSDAILSPITSPSEAASPTSCGFPGASNFGSTSDHAFPSHPSLPTLISGASSVSADAEGDFLANPGTVEGHESVLSTRASPTSLTPPSMSKQVSNEIDTVSIASEPAVADDDEAGYNGDGDAALMAEDDSSDSDEGLTMTRRKPASRKSVVRRDTNASICSTETAKLVQSPE
ncbi:MAG: hypothetical protein M1818_008047 [Claussenomyces sp. TS43310]|nr:MAG: hypothetical protein M1818_008047 [Claussenomyces sp. TS43310]